ncbi:type II toxin-antitoxin system YafQ family toxin [Thermodesulfovibrio yellowstonii]|uniref:PZ12b n=1 Tax=Thermodesulfovibrio yellowstonii (strain ATCC 51303 / DSM 11347 / YP87) TaxID=289376 RepID=B5YIH3_THEYD|nr:type II toxin-antitoxin system YafQ family toxin [Thermodesulfovibrio yellowstonii]ACI21063.1 PZ12b [Thermodesulfovibrio yellowstonii DSM 11347]
MKKLTTTKRFLKHYKKRVSDKDDEIFKYVVDKLLKGGKLERKFRDHQLSGDLREFRECHLKNDLLLIYQAFEDEIRLIDIGSHAQLFR